MTHSIGWHLSAALGKNIRGNCQKMTASWFSTDWMKNAQSWTNQAWTQLACLNFPLYSRWIEPKPELRADRKRLWECRCGGPQGHLGALALSRDSETFCSFPGICPNSSHPHNHRALAESPLAALLCLYYIFLQNKEDLRNSCLPWPSDFLLTSGPLKSAGYQKEQACLDYRCSPAQEPDLSLPGCVV